MNVSFSELYKCHQFVRWSPDGKYLATLSRSSKDRPPRLHIRDGESLEITQIQTTQDEVNKVEWSSDSRFVLCAQYKRGIVQVWSSEDDQWSCTIDEGLAGLASAFWAPDNRHICTGTDFNIRLTVWSLTDSTAHYVKFPKMGEKGCRFTSNGKYLAVAERREHKDYIAIYSTDRWEMLQRFPVDTTDLVGIKWSPDDREICVIDTSLEYKFLVYTPQGTKLAEYVAYEKALGVKTVEWSPSGQFLAVGSYDKVCRVFHNVTWKVLGEFEHKRRIQGECGSFYEKTLVYREVPVRGETDDDAKTEEYALEEAGAGRYGAKSAKVKAPPKLVEQNKTRYEWIRLPASVPAVKVKLEHNPKMGVGKIAWSACGRYVATRNDDMPCAVWVWDMQKLALHSLVLHMNPVKQFKWDPVHMRLAICCGNEKLYLWTKQGCVTIRVLAQDFSVRGLRWRSDGAAVALVDRNRYCCCYCTFDC